MPKEDANSPPRPHPPIGIDLGTTYSAIAYLDETGRPTTLANSLGDLLTPSAVLVDRHEIVMGREAAKASAVEPQSHAECFKRNIGTAVYRRDVRGAQVPPEVLSEVGQAVPDELCVVIPCLLLCTAIAKGQSNIPVRGHV
jgi:molecular chaperone DnaK (HSP70)